MIVARREMRSISAGFTLLEAVLATSIAAVLAVAVYATLSMHYQQREITQGIIDRAQMTRSLSELIRRDLSATFTAWDPNAIDNGFTEDDESSEGGSSSLSTATTTTTLTSDLVPPKGGVLGDVNMLTIVRWGTPETMKYADPNITEEMLSGVPAESDVRLIRYRLSVLGELELPTLPAWLEDADTETVVLVREEFVRVPRTDGLSDPYELAQTQVLASEVGYLQFRYLGESDWQESWVATETTPPFALEVTLGLIDDTTSDEIRESARSRAGGSSSGSSSAPDEDLRMIRLVTALTPPPPASSTEESSSETSTDSSSATSSVLGGF